jgi:DNA replication and repair protein RecF
MYVTRLRLTHFRNYEALDMAPGRGPNLLVGGNAQGKTNVLEALTLLSTSKSPRAGRESELISFGETMTHVSADISRVTSNDLSLDVILTPPEGPAPPGSVQKTVRINTVRHNRAVDLLGELQTVGFWPDDVEVVRGEPSLRRRFLNTAICQISPRYCFHLAQYRRVLEQRNRLLKGIRMRGGRIAGDSLAVWNEQLAHYGALIVERRARFIRDLEDRARTVHAELTGGEELSVAYLPNVPLDGAESLEDVTAAFTRRLAAVAEDEMQRGVTLAGPHRDDMAFALGGADARTFGSLGQQRSVALSLRIAELRLMEEEAGEPCVVLMDEIMAELDDERARRLVGLAMEGRQSFITSTGTRRFPREFLENAAVWDVNAATLSRG